MPPSVCTAIRAWMESSGLISADQPPLGLSPMSGAATMVLILASLLIEALDPVCRPALRNLAEGFAPRKKGAAPAAPVGRIHCFRPIPPHLTPHSRGAGRSGSVEPANSRGT